MSYSMFVNLGVELSRKGSGLLDWGVFGDFKYQQHFSEITLIYKMVSLLIHVCS